MTQPYFSLPEQIGKNLQLGQLVGSSVSLVSADIIQRHSGVVVFVTTDMQKALRLKNEVSSFCQEEIVMLEDWETLPYDSFSPHQDIVSSRLSCFYHLPQMKKGGFILPINTLMQKVCPAQFLYQYALMIHKGQILPRDQLRQKLEQAGYRSVDQVIAHGEFATRGALLDLFPMGCNEPFRLDFFDNEIDSIRTFDIDNQRTISEIDSIQLLPAHEFPTDPAAIERFRRQWREIFDIRRDAEHIYQQVSKHILAPGIEYWQPLFFEQPLATLFSYFPENTLLVTVDDLNSSAEHYWQDIHQRYQSRRVDPMRPLLKPETLWLATNELFAEFKKLPQISLVSDSVTEKKKQLNLPYQTLPALMMQAQNKAPLDLLRQFLEQFQGKVVFSVETEGRRETLLALLSRIKVKPKSISDLSQANAPGYYIIIGACEHGFIDTEQQLAFICEADLLGERIQQRRHDKKRAINADAFIRNLAELHPGQPVVHIDHGIGRYGGLTTLEAGGVKGEYMIIHYAGEDKLYVPISSLHLISRYSGSNEEHAPLHKLGGETWQKARQKAAEKIRDVAAELLDIYARRENSPGFAFQIDDENYRLFCESFPYEPTPDQQRAIDAVLADMSRPVAMDRLVCGDVGFGKTEVAMRAAFVSVMNHKQVAILVPTTLLAQQHYENFRDRFANWPIVVEMVSRFRSSKEHKQILQQTAEGKVDILIGTHKLLQSDVIWHDLGLLIIDEEHRFGVQQKELIKAMRSHVDILTLTATPIPRTLNMAISSIRDLSIIATPPERRLSVKTFVREYNPQVIRDAILREILRGGQVYFLHNDVASIQKAAEELAKLVPEARVIIGHGQMPERELERVMNDFHHQRANILVCTTIIETGIDIPNANTIIIARADCLGLAQLHQLRGRVGRSHHQAYAYLLTPPPKAMTKDAHKRLEAIASLEDLGAGFVLATHDLEIRGAGELLGEDQSGQMNTIGFSLYNELLEQAVESLKEGREPSLNDLNKKQIDIELRIPCLFPDDYMPDVNNRLSFYKRIAGAKQPQELDEIKVELIDRFGLLPEPANYLLRTAAIRQQAQFLGIKKIEASSQSGSIEFNENNKIDLMYLLQLLKQEPDHYRLNGSDKLKFMYDLSESSARLNFVEELLSQFQAHQVTES